MSSIRAALFAGLCLSCASPALAGPDWIEGGVFGGPDAGSTKDTAQPIVGIGTLRRITGTLSSGSTIIGGGGGPDPAAVDDYEDMYLIRIDVPSTFSFEVTSADFDAQLWLFNLTLPGEAFGLLANNDTPLSTSPKLITPATDSTGANVVFPGIYAIAISGLGRVPVSLGGEIFNFVNPTEVSGPDGPGGLLGHIGWTGIGQTGGYTIEVEDVGWYDVPAPGAATLFMTGAGLLGLRRRRR